GASSTTRLATGTLDANPFLINLPTTSTDTDVAVFPAGTTAFPTSILDKGMFDGREQMAVRVADLDLARLTATTVSGGTDKWIPNVTCDNVANNAIPDCAVFSEGVVYAFREDAVREDEIVRPKNASATTTNCLSVATLTTGNCLMSTSPSGYQDPPLTDKGMSLKPVDYVADPDRRPHGFRLRNGADLSNGKARDVGMTFVTDNSVYIQGDFNLHVGQVKYRNSSGVETTDAATGVMEEFRATVNDKVWTKANFYNDRTEQGNGGLNLNFAQKATDTWRPVEILADSFTILSSDFVDGSAADTFTQARPSSAASTSSSYLNQSRPNTAQNVVRENGNFSTPATASSTTDAAPVLIDRNGHALVSTTAANGSTTISKINTVSGWTTLASSVSDRNRNLHSVSANVQVNAVFISGIPPSRTGQGYGGLQNFPRLIEDWTGDTLIINGAFAQLNFATSATGPFEHDAWEPGSTVNSSSDNIGYFVAPTRRWSYDPALLLYERPAAASRRFSSMGSTRSEYFRDLPADDPYVKLLRCAKQGNTFVFTDANVRGTCP
ncbi:MAG: hypothetical protein VKI82_14915, partial [Leptolyngbya sp.]|nr:hypothetical protein [Leptolyngbya sp.]